MTNKLLTLPTGSGKTYQASLCAAQTLEGQGKVIVTAPTIALTNEIGRDWQARFPQYVVEAYTSEKRSVKPYAKANIIVMTPERLDLITRSWQKHWRWLSHVDLLVCDEFHQITDPARGPALENAITRVRLLRPDAQILALTATCGNPAEITEWLEAEHVHSDVRRWPLSWQTFTTPNKAALLWEKLSHEATIVFVHSRSRASTLAEEARKAGYAAASHHAGLNQEERERTEEMYRCGTLTLLFATPTLALGVNLPAEHVILLDMSFYGRPPEPLSVIEVWQRAGRAGRAGPGRVTLIATPKENPPERYLEPNFEALRSPLQRDTAQEGFVLGAIHGGYAHTDAQLSRLSARTFGQPDLSGTLTALLEAHATEDTRHGYRLTPLGLVAARTMLRCKDLAAYTTLPQSVASDPTAFDLILHAATRRHPLRLTPESQLLIEAALQQAPSQLLDAHEWYEPEVLASAAAAYQACLAGDEETALSCGLWPHDLRKYREELWRLMLGWQACFPHPKTQLTAMMLRSALPLSAATLTLLSGVGPTLAARWFKNGIDDVEEFAALLPGDARLEHLSIRRQTSLIEQAESLVKTFTHDITREKPPQNRATDWHLPLNLQGAVDPVRLHRAASLHVEPFGDGYLVTGGHAPHHVTRTFACDCPDTMRPCKHVLAVRLFEHDPATVHNLELLTP